MDEGKILKYFLFAVAAIVLIGLATKVLKSKEEIEAPPAVEAPAEPAAPVEAVSAETPLVDILKLYMLSLGNED